MADISWTILILLKISLSIFWVYDSHTKYRIVYFLKINNVTIFVIMLPLVESSLFIHTGRARLRDRCRFFKILLSVGFGQCEHFCTISYFSLTYLVSVRVKTTQNSLHLFEYENGAEDFLGFKSPIGPIEPNVNIY